MTECGQRAILLVTGTVEGTATHVARRRVELICRLAEAHDGPHHDPVHREYWEARPGQVPTILHHEDEEGAGGAG